MVEDLDIPGTVNWVRDLGLKRIALQLPDELMHTAARLVASLREAGGVGGEEQYFVMADSSVSSWDPDTVAAQHVVADGMVVYGRVALSRTDAMPVRHVFGRKELDIASLGACVKERFGSGGGGRGAVAVVLAAPYVHLADKVAVELGDAAVVGRLICENEEDVEEGQRRGMRLGNYEVVWGAEQKGAVVYVGDQGAELTRMMIEHTELTFVNYEPSGEIGESGERGGGCLVELEACGKALKRRYFLMNKAKDAERIGIVVATTSVTGYFDMVLRLKKVISDSGRRPYVFYVGKINPAKLANFPEIEAFVLVASPENSVTLQADAADYYRPLLTPFELEIALVKGREWTGSYDLDFRPLLKTVLPEVGPDGDGSDEETATISLTSGAVVRSGGGGALTASGGVLSAGQLLATRTYKGLDNSVEGPGGDGGLEMVQGRVGIASAYSDEQAAWDGGLLDKAGVDKRVAAQAKGGQEPHDRAKERVVVANEDGVKAAAGVAPREGGEEQEDLDMGDAGEALDDFFDAFD